VEKVTFNLEDAKGYHVLLAMGNLAPYPEGDESAFIKIFTGKYHCLWMGFLSTDNANILIFLE